MYVSCSGKRERDRRCQRRSETFTEIKYDFCLLIWLGAYILGVGHSTIFKLPRSRDHHEESIYLHTKNVINAADIFFCHIFSSFPFCHSLLLCHHHFHVQRSVVVPFRCSALTLPPLPNHLIRASGTTGFTTTSQQWIPASPQNEKPKAKSLRTNQPNWRQLHHVKDSLFRFKCRDFLSTVRSSRTSSLKRGTKVKHTKNNLILTKSLLRGRKIVMNRYTTCRISKNPKMPREE